MINVIINRRNRDFNPFGCIDIFRYLCRDNVIRFPTINSFIIHRSDSFSLQFLRSKRALNYEQSLSAL